MKRRHALKNATLLAFGMALGKLDALKASNGQLTVPLDQWGSIVFEHKGKKITVRVDEIFRALQEEQL
jgi:hypothetical protein